MSNNSISENIDDNELTKRKNVVSLFHYIKELANLNQKAILNINKHNWSLAISDIPNDPQNISVFYRDCVDEESTSIDNILLSVHKPKFQQCPKPENIFAEWLENNWDSDKIPLATVKNTLIDEIEIIDEDELYEEPERFADDIKRVEAFNEWQKQRSTWVEKQQIAKKTWNLFTDLYRLYFELEKDSETLEIIVANGMLCDKEKPDLHHPVLTRRVKINYDSEKDTVTIEDTNSSSELYSIALQAMEDINLIAINESNLQENDYHPLDRNYTPGFLKTLINQLSSESLFSDDGIPANWKNTARLLLYTSPIYIVRKRLDGTVKVIEQIISDIEETGEIPAPINDVVNGGTIEIPENLNEDSIEEQLASVGGESVDILLTKEANREQLEIAKRIEYYNAVLVQGPPGTGKTHTIANLLGHFLAQGKTVLVTSHTTKALSVLKEKVYRGLQDLCVSILDDSNVDMERSVDGITGYIAKKTSHELRREMLRLKDERNDIINKLSITRRKIFSTINQECNSIPYNGEEITPSKAAEFVLNHAEELSYIPGKVRLNHPFPLTFKELEALYHSNESLSKADELELETKIPAPSTIISPDEFDLIWKNYQSALSQLETLKTTSNWNIEWLKDNHEITLACPFGTFTISPESINSITDLKDYVLSFGKIEKWMHAVTVDGKNGGAFRQRWLTLINQIEKTYSYAESITEEQFGLDIEFINPDTKATLQETLKNLKNIFSKKGKISKIKRLFSKECDNTLKAVTINGKELQSSAECDIILHYIEMEEIRKQCAKYWDELFIPHDIPKFFELTTQNQENTANKFIPEIKKYLDWHKNNYTILIEKLDKCNFPINNIFSFNKLDSDFIIIDKIFSAIENIIPTLCNIYEEINKIATQLNILSDQKKILTTENRINSKCCLNILNAINTGDLNAYTTAYAELDLMYKKYTLQDNRKNILKTLKPIAPQWEYEIRNRIGIHGNCTPPSTIEDAWKWKQLSAIIDNITAEPFHQLQAESHDLSKEYRRITASYAEKSAWYHLLKNTESNISMKQALQGWKQTIKKIGKGTGKNAPKLKAKARELMAKCQNAVPSWIMPINKALESLNPKLNRFDIIIIDEASQSDISSLAILYMGKKLIIVGDDKQVSPMGIGSEIDKINALEQLYLKERVPNSHLYSANTSIYDIAATTFQPLMLREHFRCVPEIIGFSNMLSYDYKIKQLRTANSSNLLPAVVNYRVDKGTRQSNAKTNPNEAKTIIALMQSCIEQPEYQGKTIGIISLLGDEQVKLIQKLIEEKFDSKEIKNRRILCGNSANFQGDERNVIFLSLVDSGNGSGPLFLQTFGREDSTRKRYNVATSRAKDQLWVVHSLDPAIDLKPGDIRKILIDYASNPHNSELKHAEVEKKAESPFEAAIASALVTRGYHLEQQWEVGAYRLDMVVIFKKDMIAIECDGERWHSGEAKIREDMERQTILERLGWKFIRIRGSEYYRNPEITITNLINELTKQGIRPESTAPISDNSNNFELLERVKTRANILLSEEDDIPSESKDETIASALNPAENILKSIDLFISEQNSINSKKEEELLTDPIENPTEQTSTLISLNDTADSPKREEGIEQPGTIDHQQNIKQKQPPSSSEPTEAIPTDETSLISDEKEITPLIKKHSTHYLDKQKYNDALWSIRDHELNDSVRETLSLHFHFKPDEGKTTKGKPTWEDK